MAVPTPSKRFPSRLPFQQSNSPFSNQKTIPYSTSADALENTLSFGQPTPDSIQQIHRNELVINNRHGNGYRIEKNDIAKRFSLIDEVLTEQLKCEKSFAALWSA